MSTGRGGLLRIAGWHDGLGDASPKAGNAAAAWADR